jgi:hypothetical protein
MNPIIILGMDNTGKTTLQKELVKAFKNRGVDAQALKSPGPGPKKVLMEWVLSNIHNQFYESRVNIYDRFTCIDQQIYGPICRNEFDTDYDMVTEVLLEGISTESRPMFIYCRPDKESILGFADGREQMEGVVENGREILEKFDELYFSLKAKGELIELYDYRTSSVDKLVSIHQEIIKAVDDTLLNNVDTNEVETVLKMGPDFDFEGGLGRVSDYILMTGLIRDVKRGLLLQGKLNSPEMDEIINKYVEFNEYTNKAIQEYINKL